MGARPFETDQQPPKTAGQPPKSTPAPTMNFPAPSRKRPSKADGNKWIHLYGREKRMKGRQTAETIQKANSLCVSLISVRVRVCGSACVSACACAHVFSHASVYALALAIVRSSMYWLLISIAIFFFLRMVIWYSTSLDCGIITQLEVPELNFPIINKSWRARTERFRKQWLTFIFYNNVDMRRYNVWRKKK